MKTLLRIFLLGLWVHLFSANVVHAAALQISPVKIIFDQNHQIQTLKITNQGEAPVVLQLDVKRWLQDPQSGNDIYDPTKEMIVTPSLFTLEGGQQQLVRVAFLGEVQIPNEMAFRLILREVPTQMPAQSTGTLKMTLQTLLPVFVVPQGDLQSNYTWVSDAKGVTVTNTGQKHILVKGLTLKDQDKQLLGKKKVFSYLLPGTSKAFSLDNHEPLPHPFGAKLTLSLDGE